MKSIISKSITPVIFFSGIFFAGCYTEFAAADRSQQDDYTTDYSSDTTAAGDQSAIDNNYYLDDNFRQSRFRLSFNYYYPSYYPSVIGSYYYSYFNDPYWGWGPRWSYYDYGGCIYPRPVVYDPWWPYYPVYYPGYYHHYWGSSYGYANPPVNTGNRKRADGPSHEYTSGADRSRPIQSPASPNTAVASAPRTRESSPAREAVPAVRNRRAQDEIPWWKRQESERARASSGEVRQTNPARSSGEARKDQQTRPAERQRRENVRMSNQPSLGTTPQQQEPKPAVRQRESSRQPSYSPPQRSSQPSYSPPPSSGNSGRSSSSGGSNGRKRD